MTTLPHLLTMNGYGFYIWAAYGTVIVWLALQWFFPWQRWKHYLRDRQHEQNS